MHGRKHWLDFVTLSRCAEVRLLAVDGDTNFQVQRCLFLRHPPQLQRAYTWEAITPGGRVKHLQLKD